MIVKKAGTILLNLETKQIGLIYRDKLNDYTFPKGHLEIGETLEECAVRETEEETLRKNHLLSNTPISVERYVTPSGEDVENHLYVAIDDGETDKDIAIGDRENLRWVNMDSVMDLLSYGDLKQLWKEIYNEIQEIFSKN